jgi:hypothetical protein
MGLSLSWLLSSRRYITYGHPGFSVVDLSALATCDMTACGHEAHVVDSICSVARLHSTIDHCMSALAIAMSARAARRCRQSPWVSG